MEKSEEGQPFGLSNVAGNDDYLAARIALLLMATAHPDCSDDIWPKKVTLATSPPTDVDSAARTLAWLGKPIQCEAQCGPDGLAVKFSAITEPRFSQAHAVQVAMLERGEGVIGSICAQGTKVVSTVSLVGLGQVLDIPITALEKLQKDYLITMPVALSSNKLEEGALQGLAKWTIFTGRVRAVSKDEVEELLDTLERLPPE